MQQKRQAGCDPALSAATEFQDMIAKLTRRLSVHPCQVIVHKRPPRFGPIFAERMLTESESLRRDLTVIHEFTDVEAAHRARIAAKRLRYVVELLSKLGDDADAIIDTLKSLQDALGDLHDVHVFLFEVEAAEVNEAVRPGLLRIARRLHERGALAYARIERDWLNDAGALFFDRVREQAAGIARRPPDRNEMQNT